MLRKSVVIVALLLSGVASQVMALGLGQVSVESALNQPLRVRIEILDLGDTRLQDVIVQMASVDDFQRFDVERVVFLNNIRFEVQAVPSGNFVTLTTTQVVREPYLNFILETRWPNGRLLSEHTILFDLPVFDDGQPSDAFRSPISPILERPDGVEPDQIFRDQSAPTPAVTPSSPSAAPVLAPELIDTPPAVQEQEPEPEPEVIEEPEPLPTELAEEPVPEPEPEVIEEPEPEVIEEPQPIIAEEIIEEPEPIPAEIPDSIEVLAGDNLTDIALRVRPDPSVSIQQTMIALQRLNPDAFADGNINRLRRGEILRVPSLEDIQAINPREAIAEVARQNQEIADAQPLTPASTATPGPDEEPRGQLSVVTGDPDVDAAGGGTGTDLDELDQRIADLENQLALSQEAADRARIEREELQARLAELEAQIDSAQELIRLQDLQLAQLQESLAQAAAEAAAAAAAAPAAQVSPQPAAAIQPAQPTSFLDSLLRMFTGNSMIMLVGVGVIILLLVALLLLRNRFAFAGGGKMDDDLGGGSEADDDLDSELDEIIGLGEADDDVVLDDDDDAKVAELKLSLEDQVNMLMEQGELDDAGKLLRKTLAAQADDHEMRLKLCHVLGRQQDQGAFEEQAAILSEEMSPVLDRQVKAIRLEHFGSDASPKAAPGSAQKKAAPESKKPEKAEKKSTESASFLDDLGIDLDSFEDEEGSHDLELSEDIGEAMDEDTAAEAGLEFEEPDDVEMTFDLSAEDEKKKEKKAKEAAAEEEIDILADTAPSATDESESDEVEIDLDDEPVEAAGAGEVDALEFDMDEAVEVEQEMEAKPEAEIDLNAFEFETDALAGKEPEKEPEKEATGDDDMGVEFDFDKSELAVEPATDEAETEDGKGAATEKETTDIETFDFDLDDSSTDTVVEKPDTGGEAADEAAVDTGDSETVDIDDFDFDLDEIDLELGAEGDEAARAIASADDEGEVELIVDDDESPTPAAESEDDDLSDLGFLSGDDEVEIESVGDVEEVELLSDDDETATKLELAYAYQKMGDTDGAREILQEVVKEGSDAQVKEAKELMASLEAATD